MNNLEGFLGVIFYFFHMSMGSKYLYLDLNTIVILLLSLQPVHTPVRTNETPRNKHGSQDPCTDHMPTFLGPEQKREIRKPMLLQK